MTRRYLKRRSSVATPAIETLFGTPQVVQRSCSDGKDGQRQAEGEEVCRQAHGCSDRDGCDDRCHHAGL